MKLLHQSCGYQVWGRAIEPYSLAAIKNDLEFGYLRPLFQWQVTSI